MSKNLPRSYSTLRGGQIVWADPDTKPAVPPKVRSRLETDKEVIARIKEWYPATYRNMAGDESGHKLDQLLKHLGTKRHHIDEVIS